MKQAIIKLLLGVLVGTFPLSVAAKDVLNVGSIPIITELPLHTAIANKYFEAEGIEIKIQTVAGGAAAIPALVGGSLQLTMSAYIAVFKARDAGFDVVIVFPYSRQLRDSDPDAVVVRAESPIKEARDLEGKKVAVNVIKDIAWLYVSEWISLRGGDPRKVNFLEIPFPNMIAALRAGTVDAVDAVEPFVTIEMETGGIRILDHAVTTVDPATEMAGLVAMAGWTRANPELLERFARAMRRGTDYLLVHQEEWARLLGLYTRLDPKVVAKMAKPTFGYPLKLDGLQRASHLALKWGLIKKKQNVADFVWPTALP